MAPRAGAQTLCCHAPAAADLDTASAAAAAASAASQPPDMGASERSLEPAPASGEVDLLGEKNSKNRAHVEAGDSPLHPRSVSKGASFGSLDSASAVAGTVKGGIRILFLSSNFSAVTDSNLPYVDVFALSHSL